MRKIILVILTAFFISESFAQMTLENDTIIVKYFDKSEINELRQLLVFFDSIVINDCDSKEILDSCYVQYYTSIYEKAYSTGHFDYKLDNNPLIEIVDGLSESTFNKIWKLENYYIWKPTGERDSYKSLEVQMYSVYMNFIKEVAQLDTNFYNYHDEIMAAGDISPGLVPEMLRICRSFNYQIERVRLFLAIHYTSIMLFETYRLKVQLLTASHTTCGVLWFADNLLASRQEYYISVGSVRGTMKRSETPARPVKQG